MRKTANLSLPLSKINDYVPKCSVIAPRCCRSVAAGQVAIAGSGPASRSTKRGLAGRHAMGLGVEQISGRRASVQAIKSSGVKESTGLEAQPRGIAFGST